MLTFSALLEKNNPGMPQCVLDQIVRVIPPALSEDIIAFWKQHLLGGHLQHQLHGLLRYQKTVLGIKGRQWEHSVWPVAEFLYQALYAPEISTSQYGGLIHFSENVPEVDILSQNFVIFSNVTLSDTASYLAMQLAFLMLGFLMSLWMGQEVVSYQNIGFSVVIAVVSMCVALQKNARVNQVRTKISGKLCDPRWDDCLIQMMNMASREGAVDLAQRSHRYPDLSMRQAFLLQLYAGDIKNLSDIWNAPAENEIYTEPRGVAGLRKAYFAHTMRDSSHRVNYFGRYGAERFKGSIDPWVFLLSALYAQKTTEAQLLLSHAGFSREDVKRYAWALWIMAPWAFGILSEIKGNTPAALFNSIVNGIHHFSNVRTLPFIKMLLSGFFLYKTRQQDPAKLKRIQRALIQPLQARQLDQELTQYVQKSVGNQVLSLSWDQQVKVEGVKAPLTLRELMMLAWISGEFQCVQSMHLLVIGETVTGMALVNPAQMADPMRQALTVPTTVPTTAPLALHNT